jgi:Protein of unknown function (DUF1552)
VTRKVELRRRAFLRGVGGVIVGLPFLEALAPKAHAQSGGAVKRFGVFFCCNGVNMSKWFPTSGYGPLTAAGLLGTTNEALTPHAAKLLFPRGIHMSPRGYDQDGGGGDDHGKGMAHKLTAQFASEDEWLAQGESIDYHLARQINPGPEGARRPPLNLMVGYSANYKGLDYISYSGPGKAVQAINNPWTAYKQFMNLGVTMDSGEAEMRIAKRRQSVLDLVGEQFNDLKRGPLSKADKDKLDQHFSYIRDLESGMSKGLVSCLDDATKTRAQTYEERGEGEEFDGQYDEYGKLTELQLDIYALALACDYTRVVTFHFDRGSGGPTFKWDGMDHEYNHHKLSHGTTCDSGCEDAVAGYESMLAGIDTWHMKHYARLLAKLDSYTEENGKTILDNSAILYANELSDGKLHSFLDLPFIIAGSAGGYFKQGEYVKLAEPGDNKVAPHNRLLTTLVNAMGVPLDRFGTTDPAAQTAQSGQYEALLA